MCGGVEAREADKIWKIYFPNPKAGLPVMLEDSGQMVWITWGRRKEQQGYEPQGGWAKLSTVQAGGWDKYRPRRGFGMVQRFMEKEGQSGEKNRPSHWFDVPEGYALECLVIGEGEQRRVYVVTIEAPAEYAWIHDRWPLLASPPRVEGQGWLARAVVANLPKQSSGTQEIGDVNSSISAVSVSFGKPGPIH